MILRLRVEHMKDATNEKKRVIMATLTTGIIGMETISTVAELDSRCVLSQEIDDLIANMVKLKKEDIISKKDSKLPKRKKK